MKTLPSLFPHFILVIGLFFVACQKTPEQPIVTQVAFPTPTYTNTPTSTDPPPTTPVATATLPPQPFHTPLPTATPTLLPTPIPAPPPTLLQTQIPLGLNWGLSGLGTRLLLTEQYPVMVYRSFYPRSGVYLANADTGEIILEIPANKRSIEYDAAGDTLYIILSDDDNPVVSVQAFALVNGGFLWDVSLEQPDLSEVVAFDDGLLLIEHHYGSGPNHTLTFLEASDGQVRWQIRPNRGCFIHHDDVQRLDDDLYVVCDEAIFRLDVTTGEELAFLATAPGFVHTFRVTTQAIYLKRAVWENEHFNGTTVEVEHYYVEARELDNYQVLWSVEVPADAHDFAIFAGDLVYRANNQVIRLNPVTGQTVWQTTILGEVPSNLLLQGQWLLVGSHVGYVHLLNVQTGEVAWEQDVWATIEPRFIYVAPIALLDDALILGVDYGFVSLGLTQESIWQEPTPAPTTVPAPIPTATPLPFFTPLAPGTWPTVPETTALWPSVILSFLNSDPDNIGQVEPLLTEWLESQGIRSSLPRLTVQRVDVNGDDLDELLLLIHGTYVDFWEGWALVIEQKVNGQYQLAWSRPAVMPNIVTVTDVNGDGWADFVFVDVSYGVSQAYGTVIPVAWDGQVYQNLAYEPIATTNIIPEQVRVEDTTGDGRLEIIIHGGTYGSAGAGPNRASTFTYTLSEQGYVLLSQEPDLPQLYYFFLVDANYRLVAGDYEGAIALYASSYSSWDAIFSDYDDDHQHAFAEFQLMLAYLLLGDEEMAARWANTGAYPDQLYSEVKLIFWDVYQESHDWTAAAEAARKRVRLAGVSRAQLTSWVGYANTALTLDDICPCADCLQGSLGSLYGP